MSAKHRIYRLLNTLIMTTLLTIAVLALTSNRSHAQIDGSIAGGIKGMEIEIEGFSCSNGSCGMVVVVPDGAAAPRGYEPGKIYWAWPKGIPWKYGFTLVPTARIPKFDQYAWQVLDNGRFDLSRTYPFPPLSLEEEESFYTFFVRENQQWLPSGWLWVRNRDRLSQTWFGFQLTKPLIGGESDPIRFIPQAPPPAGSVEIYREF